MSIADCKEPTVSAEESRHNEVVAKDSYTGTIFIPFSYRSEPLLRFSSRKVKNPPRHLYLHANCCKSHQHISQPTILCAAHERSMKADFRMEAFGHNTKLDRPQLVLPARFTLLDHKLGAIAAVHYEQ